MDDPTGELIAELDKAATVMAEDDPPPEVAVTRDPELIDGIPEHLHVDIESTIHQHMGHDGQSDETNDWVTDLMSALSPLIERALALAEAPQPKVLPFDDSLSDTEFEEYCEVFDPPQPKVLTEAEATWHQLASESPAGSPARWSHAINAIVNDSGKWDRWPENGPEGWWNVRVAQSAIENLYRYGFAVVAVTPGAIERIVAAADRVLVVEAPASPAPQEPQ